MSLTAFLTQQDRDQIVQYVANNKKELTVVLSSLTEAARQKNGEKISKDLFYENLNWMHSLVWTAIVSGVKTGSNFRKSYDYTFEAYKLTVENPEEALARYKAIMGEDAKTQGLRLNPTLRAYL